MTKSVEIAGNHEGPVMTDQDGNLSAPILMCAYGKTRCKHFGVHDWHYFYCAAQDAPNKHSGQECYAYPWRGAGKQLRTNKPDEGCPFVMPNVEAKEDGGPAGSAGSAAGDTEE